MIDEQVGKYLASARTHAGGIGGTSTRAAVYDLIAAVELLLDDRVIEVDEPRRMVLDNDDLAEPIKYADLGRYEQWMVKQNVEYAAAEGLEVAVNRLKAGGYDRVADAVTIERLEYKAFATKEEAQRWCRREKAPRRKKDRA